MYKEITQYISNKNVTLVAVSKTKPIQAIMPLYKQGQRIFGENRVQEMVEKYSQMPKDIQWHLIGHLQKNKVKYIAPFVSMIHSVDSFDLLKVINKQAKRNDRIIPVLLQFHIAQEESKYGLRIDEGLEIIQSLHTHPMDNISIRGVMGMATFSDDTELVRSEFRKLKAYYDLLKSQQYVQTDSFNQISMGMSGDYKIAIEEGSTMIRVGSAIFGERG